MGKLPAIQFYPGDWRKDVGVQSLTFHDRGVWFELLMLMHESERRGVLVLNGRAIPESALARLLGLDNQILTTTLTTLLDVGVVSVEEATGALMSRRMVRDEHLRTVRAECGKLGGNPALKPSLVKQRSTIPLKQRTTTRDKQKATPSSSSSISSSEEVTATGAGVRDVDPATEMLPPWLPAETWASWERTRKALKRPVTDDARRLQIKKLEALRAKGHDPQAVLEQSIANGWQGLFEIKPDIQHTITGGQGHGSNTRKPTAEERQQGIADNVARAIARGEARMGSHADRHHGVTEAGAYAH